MSYFEFRELLESQTPWFVPFIVPFIAAIIMIIALKSRKK